MLHSAWSKNWEFRGKSGVGKCPKPQKSLVCTASQKAGIGNNIILAKRPISPTLSIQHDHLKFCQKNEFLSCTANHPG